MRAMRYYLQGARACRWNAERFIVSQMVILQHMQHVSGSQVIRRSIEKCLDAWEAGQNQILFKETAHTCNQYLSTSCSKELEEHHAQTFHILVIIIQLQTAVRWVTEQKKESEMLPRYLCTKIDGPVLEMLWGKHPESCAPLYISLDAYPGRPPELVPVKPTEDIVIEVVRRLSGGAGPWSTG